VDPNHESPRSHRWPAVLFLGASAAFHLVELLVVIAIIGILLALLIPAVQVRGSCSPNGMCQQHEQIGLAIAHYQLAKEVYPQQYRQLVHWDAAGTLRNHSWASLIMPYAELSSLNNTIDYSVSAMNTAKCNGGRHDCFPCIAVLSYIGPDFTTDVHYPPGKYAMATTFRWRHRISITCGECNCSPKRNLSGVEDPARRCDRWAFQNRFHRRKAAKKKCASGSMGGLPQIPRCPMIRPCPFQSTHAQHFVELHALLQRRRYCLPSTDRRVCILVARCICTAMLRSILLDKLSANVYVALCTRAGGEVTDHAE